MGPVLLSLTLFILASTSIPSLSQYSIAARIAGILAVTIPVFWRKQSAPQSRPRSLLGMLHFCVGFGIYLIASTYLHGLTDALLAGIMPLLLVPILVHVLQSYYSVKEIVSGAYAALILVCGVSILYSYLNPAIALEHSRLRGIVENANGLGFVAFALGAVAVAACQKAWAYYCALAVAGGCLLMSASRASAIALTITVVCLAVAESHRARMLLGCCGVVGFVVWLLSPSWPTELSILRTTDTRPGVLGLVELVVAESPWIGLGKRSGDTVVAGSPFAAAITGGIIGTLGLSIMYISLIYMYAVSRPRALVFLLAALFHSVFESWMLSFSAPMLLTFIVVIVGLSGIDSVKHGSEPDRANRVDSIHRKHVPTH